ncbi:hypothetical protein [Photorhabdus bodei]|uniref:hypothetical protein n=1 Tax=Photorhabdus bodei TaxID=2029681 RepID=UPI001E563FEB|nr:hypothetical protein [Photorhabdus bodei]MCC8466872.1 hypothetical protein [Photorhabdus bodei]
MTIMAWPYIKFLLLTNDRRKFRRKYDESNTGDYLRSQSLQTKSLAGRVLVWLYSNGKQQITLYYIEFQATHCVVFSFHT